MQNRAIRTKKLPMRLGDGRGHVQIQPPRAAGPVEGMQVAAVAGVQRGGHVGIQRHDRRGIGIVQDQRVTADAGIAGVDVQRIGARVQHLHRIAGQAKAIRGREPCGAHGRGAGQLPEQRGAVAACVGDDARRFGDHKGVSIYRLAIGQVTGNFGAQGGRGRVYRRGHANGHVVDGHAHDRGTAVLCLDCAAQVGQFQPADIEAIQQRGCRAANGQRHRHLGPARRAGRGQSETAGAADQVADPQSQPGQRHLRQRAAKVQRQMRHRGIPGILIQVDHGTQNAGGVGLQPQEIDRAPRAIGGGWQQQG